MSSSGANPFTCDMLREERRCGADAKLLYRTATSTKVVCDFCAAELRNRPKQLAAVPVVEFALAELTPARAVLLQELEAAKTALDGTKVHLRQSMAVIAVYESVPGLKWLLSGRVRAATAGESGK